MVMANLMIVAEWHPLESIRAHSRCGISESLVSLRIIESNHTISGRPKSTFEALTRSVGMLLS
jgi:hypothetical protein